MDELPELVVADGVKWHDWLIDNHEVHRGVCLVLHKKGGNVTELTYAVALDEALCFGWIDGTISKRDEGSYRQRFTRRRPNSSWSAKNVERALRLIEEGRMRPAGEAAIAEAKANGNWQNAYKSQTNAEIPPDLLAALANYPEALTKLEALSAKERYSITYHINTSKSKSTRERKINKYLEILSSKEPE
ncbi:MAG: YdeI/OmpD-associated family protein [Actinomycetota bacterium]|nr:YdeI/OmpD-associated family protein [Actinomycetota bacterium]